MSANEEKRMAGDYVIIHALHIGDREIVLGENPAGVGDERYMCAFCEANTLLASYTEVMVSDDYAKLVKLFGERVAEQAEKTRMAFLTTAAHNFKYNFHDQLLIFAQKPDATACAEISFWNKHGRWVNYGTRGIALLVDTERGYRLRHVFDMSDTNSREGRTVPIWQMKPQYESAVIEALENSYGELTGNWADRLLSIWDFLFRGGQRHGPDHAHGGPGDQPGLREQAG